MKRIILKAQEIKLKTDESWVKTPEDPNQINQKASPRRDPLFTSTLGVCASLLFSFSYSSAFGYGVGHVAYHAKPHEMGFVFPSRQVVKLLQRGLCLAAGLFGDAAL